MIRSSEFGGISEIGRFSVYRCAVEVLGTGMVSGSTLREAIRTVANPSGNSDCTSKSHLAKAAKPSFLQMQKCYMKIVRTLGTYGRRHTDTFVKADRNRDCFDTVIEGLAPFLDDLKAARRNDDDFDALEVLSLGSGLPVDIVKECSLGRTIPFGRAQSLLATAASLGNAAASRLELHRVQLHDRRYPPVESSNRIALIA